MSWQFEVSSAGVGDPMVGVADLVGWSYKTYAGCLVLGTLTTLFATPWVIRLATRLGAVDLPGYRKSHGRAVPLWGGLAIFIGMWTPILVLLVFDNLVTQQLWNRSGNIMTLFVAGVLMLVLGAIDDLIGLRVRYKLLVQIPVAIGVWVAGVKFTKLELPLLGELDATLFGPIVSIVWLVGITNAFNLIDGVDGLATGVALFVALTNGLMAVWTDSAVLAVLMFSIAGACLGFLRYNFNPARVFLGDAGSLFLGMTLGITSVLTSSKSQVASSFLIAVVVLGYPALDTLLAMVQRLLRGKSPFVGDATHIHHRLLQKGFGQRQSVLVLYIVCFLFCVAAISIVAHKNAVAAFVLMVIGVVTAYGLWALGYFRLFGKSSLQRDRWLYRMHYHFVEMIKAKIRLAETPEEVIALISALPKELGFQKLQVSFAGMKDPVSHEAYVEGAADGTDKIDGAGSATVHHDSYRYPETGLEVQAWIRETPDSVDLAVERRALLAEAVDAANKRLGELKNSSLGSL